MYLRSIDGHAAEWLELVTGQNDRGIREAFSLGDEIDLPFQRQAARASWNKTHDVHSETVGSLVQPPVHHVIDCRPELRVLPVEICRSAIEPLRTRAEVVPGCSFKKVWQYHC